MKKNIVIFVILAMAGCGRFNNAENKSADERIVCLAKQYSEIIYALDAEKDLVAVDLSSTFPPRIKSLPTVGYHRALSTEGLLAAKPTMIIHDNNIGPGHVVQQLVDLKIPMKVFQNKGHDIESTKLLIREMGDYFGKRSQADSLCNKLDRDMESVLGKVSSTEVAPKVLVIHYGQASNVYLVMTNKSTAAKMVQWAGAEMAVDEDKGMRHLSSEVVATSDPDVILVTDFGYDKLGSSEKVKELPGVSGTKAALNNRIYRVEEHDLVYIGPRTGENVLMLHDLIYRDANTE